MYVRLHKSGNDTILAACDEDILGKTFRGDGAKITVSESFYKGESIGPEAFVERMKSVSIMNLVGDEVIALAIAEGHVDEDNVMVIGGVKHAQVVIM